MAYTIQYCDDYMDQELDKLGSDYFSLPIKLMQFRKATFDFIRESTKFSEANQEVADDIHTLVREKFMEMIQSPGVKKHIWECSYPNDYHRLINVIPKYYIINTKDAAPIDEAVLINEIASEIRIIKLGQHHSYNRSPNKEATPEYPLVLRLNEKLKFDFGIDDGTIYKKAEVLYYSEPIFGDESDLNNIIVNLPKLSVEKIIDRATNSLRAITGDEHAQLNYQFDQTFAKRKG